MSKRERPEKKEEEVLIYLDYLEKSWKENQLKPLRLERLQESKAGRKMHLRLSLRGRLKKI